MLKLLLLPARTAPADVALTRRHDPLPIAKTYSAFRDCLRWEFGFTCAICLLHERDVMQYGVEGWGAMHVEHIVPRSLDAALVGVYSNVLYICRLCNTARSDTDQQDCQGRRLLDPTVDVWARHFRLDADELIPCDGDVHAEYTADVYNINDARKVKLRRRRREHVSDWLGLLSSRRQELVRLSSTNRRVSIEESDTVQAILRVHDDLARLYRNTPGEWVPGDAPDHCRCGRADACRLPEPYLRQVVEIETP